MTIDEMRDKMREKVVPEEVVPQNIINCLIDEDAEPPKLDAFTFLTRLRALGIGSADFLNLLEGCGAPESVVEKIRQNPAMNLQGLILTLDNSELTSEDYTRMMLVARQVWERTLTMRLEKSEKISREIEQESENYAEETQKTPDEQSEETTDNTVENVAIDEYDDYDEDMQEMSFTAVFDKISDEMGTSTSQNDSEDNTDSDDLTDDEENFYFDYGENDDNNDNDEETAELSFAEAFDKIKSEKNKDIAAVSTESDNSASEDTVQNDGDADSGDETNNSDKNESDGIVDTTSLIEIDEEVLRRNFEKLAENSNNKSETEGTEDAQSEQDTENEENVNTEPQKYDERDEQNDNAENEEKTENDVNDDKPHTGYFKGAIIGSAIGAAVLVGASVLGGQYFGGNDAKTLHYAADNSEIFNKIYYAYAESTPGGTAANGINADDFTIFGDLLIGGDDDSKSLGSFTIGNGFYSVTEEAISANIIENGTATTLKDLIPPEKSHFVAAFDDNGKLYALFSGEQSGFMKISDGIEEYTVCQDGILTDYSLSDGEIRLGTVYTPIFSHTFNLNDEDVYLPKVGTNDPKPISAQNIIISDTNGYSYGVSAGYSAESGELKTACAVIGDPIAASADGRFAVTGEKGLIINTNGEKLTAKATDKLSFAAFNNSGCAVIEESGNSGNNVRLLDKNSELNSILTGIPDKIKGMWFDKNILSIDGDEGGVLRIDCSDFKQPVPMSLSHANGVTSGNSALTYEITDNTISITRFNLENGISVKVSEFKKELTGAQPESIKFGDPRAVTIDGAKSGAAYSYFDGVSVISEYVVFADGEQPKTVSVFDDKTGFTAAFSNNGKINAVCSNGIKEL